MFIIDKVLDYFCDHAAILNANKNDLQMEIKILRQKYGFGLRVKGFTDYRQFFNEIHVAIARHHPYSMVFIREKESIPISLILKRTDPLIKTYNYSDTKNFENILPALR